MIHHKNLTDEKWFNYSKAQQLLMIANELNRAKNWIIKDCYNDVNLCYERAFELTDLTITDLKWKGHLKELLRFREYMAEQYHNTIKDLRINEQMRNALIALIPESFNMLH